MRQLRFDRIRQIAYPIAVYYVIYNVSYQLLLGAFGRTWGALACLLSAALITLPFIYGLYRSIPIVRERPPVEKKQFLWVLCIVLLGIALNIALTHTLLPQVSASYQTAQSVLSRGKPLIRIFANGIVIPLLEELLYRGILCGQLEEWYGTRTAVVVSAVLFGMMHFNIVQFLYAFLMGLALGMLYCRTKNLWLPMTAHGLTNLVVVVYSLLAVT